MQRRATLNDSEQKSRKETSACHGMLRPLKKSLPVVRRHKQMGAINELPTCYSLNLDWLPKDLDGAQLTKKDVYRDRILLLLSKGSPGTSEVSPRLLLSPQIETTLNPLSRSQFGFNNTEGARLSEG